MGQTRFEANSRVLIIDVSMHPFHIVGHHLKKKLNYKHIRLPVFLKNWPTFILNFITNSPRIWQKRIVDNYYSKLILNTLLKTDLFLLLNRYVLEIIILSYYVGCKGPVQQDQKWEIFSFVYLINCPSSKKCWKLCTINENKQQIYYQTDLNQNHPLTDT